MASSHFQRGNVIDHTPATAVASGAVVVMNGMVGVALADIPAGVPGAVQITDVWTFAKNPPDTFVQGALAYWDATNRRVTSASAGNTLMGRATYPSGAGATQMQVGLKGFA